MSAITISRQMSSRGDELAQQVAERLGWRQVSQTLINQAAQAAGTPHLALAEIDELGLLDLHPSARERQAYQSQVETIIRNLADEGQVVIVGRGGQVILQDRSDVFHVRVIAPFETRLLWLQQEKKISTQSAQARLQKGDQGRADYFRKNYSLRLDDPSLYHIVINTGRLPLPQAVNLVIQTYQAWVGG
jgi:cytidylate kinase